MHNDRPDDPSDTQESEFQSLVRLAAESISPRVEGRERIRLLVLAEAKKKASARNRRVFVFPRPRWAWAGATLASVALLILVGAWLSGLLSPDLQAGTLTVHSGLVTIDRVSRGWLGSSRETVHRANAGDRLAVQVGDDIKTGANTQALVRWFEGSTVELDADTRLSVEAAEPSQSRIPPLLQMQVPQGHTIHRVLALQEVPRYRVDTPSASVVVRGTVFDLRVLSQLVTLVRCQEGVVDVVSGGQVATVRAGEELDTASGRTFVARPQSPPRPQLEGGGTTLITSADTVRILGQARPAARLVITVDEVAAKHAEADTDGRFSYDFAPEEDGDYVVRAAEVVAGGVRGETSDPLTIRCDRVRPFLRVTQPLSPETSSDSVVLAGETEPDAAVTVNQLEVFVDTSGRFAVSLPIEVGDNEVVVTASDQAGNTIRFNMVILRR